MTAYYNEIDKFAAETLRNLIAAGHIAPGDVDERSIEDVHPDDLKPYTQCHFFAGVGVWSYALRAAGWPDDRPVWTGSCPCQPFSQAGQGAGFDDERHLWPTFFRLIDKRRPATVYGEQVASKDADPWLDLVHTDMEALGYAFGAVAFPSAGVGAPHIRDRTYWLAHSSGARPQRREFAGQRSGAQLQTPERSGAACGLAHSDRSSGYEGSQDIRGRTDGGDAQPWAGSGCGSVLDRLADLHGERCGEARSSGVSGGETQWLECSGGDCRLADTQQHDCGRQAEPTDHFGPQTNRSPDQHGGHSSAPVRLADSKHNGCGGSQGNSTEPGGDGQNIWLPNGRHSSPEGEPPPGPVNGLWRAADWLLCRDGKWRPVEPGTFPLAHGAAARVGRLRAYGNAINAKAAQVFIEAAMSSIDEIA